MFTWCPNRPAAEHTDVVPSFAKFLLENGPSYGITELEAAFLAGGIFGAGIHQVNVLVSCLETCTRIQYQTFFAICTVLLAAACFPGSKLKVQDELDAVIGRYQGSSIPLL